MVFSQSDLPFEIDEKKRLKPEDVENKKEGWFPTGLPFVYTDPNNGFGYGGRILLFNNKDRSDPFFEYTPYRHRIFFHYSNTTKSAQWHSIDYDAPYIFDTQFRLRASIVYDKNPNNLYFGVGESTLRGLTYRGRNDPARPLVLNGRFDDKEENQSYRRPAMGDEARYLEDRQLNSLLQTIEPRLLPTHATDKKYNRYQMENPQAAISLERSFFKGVVRAVGGARFSYSNVNFYDGTIYEVKDPVFGAFLGDQPTVNGKTKLREDCDAGKIVGCDGGYVNLLRLGLVYDTRDFEPDPNKGVFIETTHERSMRGIGSDFSYNKTFLSGRFFYSPAPAVFSKLVLAGRLAFMSTKGTAPFWEYRNMWGTETNISGIGGRTTLRGFMQDRFVAPAMGFGNLEVRWKFFEVPGFAFNLVPFFDFGRVWDEAHKANLKGYQYSWGTGLRIAWNQSTIIYLDLAYSRENSGLLYMNFNHIF